MKKFQLNMDAPEERETLFADIILPVPVPGLFTYRIPFLLNNQISIGSRVIVPFGSRKILTGVIRKIHNLPPAKYEAKLIHDVLEETPSINNFQFKLFEWIASYYMCTIGEVINVAIPSGLKLSSESLVQLHPEFDRDLSDYEFSEKEISVLNALSTDRSLPYDRIHELTDTKNIHSIIKSLVRKDAILIYESIKEKYKPKKIKKIRLTGEHLDEKVLEKLMKSLEKKGKQLDIVLMYLKTVDIFESPELNVLGMNKSDLPQSSSLQTLIKNKIFDEFEVTVPRLETFSKNLKNVILNDNQQKVLDLILQEFESKDTVLLHGITGSGKTEIYIQLIKEALDNGSQVLYLLPEIALTTQIVSRLRKVFGDKMGVYHSRFSDNERVEVWKGIQDGKFSFIVGVRSSVFLPFSSLGLVIVDEEHELSYKQFDPAPRYNARDTAIVLAGFHKSKILLGSATPSIESYFNTKHRSYGLVTLSERFTNTPLPEIIPVNMIRQRKKKLVHGEFSQPLFDAIGQALAAKEQVIIFQNRRGYAPHLVCEDCGWIPKCKNCTVSLTYHQYSKDLRCHYCGYKENIVMQCPVCGSRSLHPVKYGTEKLEEDLRMLFQNAKVQRMDLDTTRKKKSYEQIIEDFETGEIDILVGTQMVTKGLDFDGVTLVGILDIDRMMHFPDFRSYERTFQLATQVSGRAGRRDKKGLVIIQTNNTEHPLMNKIVNHNYKGMVNVEINERKRFRFPPFVRLIKIIVRHDELIICEKAAKALSIRLIQELGLQRILGPAEPMISKIRNKYLREIYIKLERDKVNLDKVKKNILEIGREIQNNKDFKKTSLIFDVDPY